MSLSLAIKDAVSFVKSRRGNQMTRAEVNELHRLGEEVYVRAYKLGLVEALPRVPELDPALASSDLPAPDPVQFESKLNLPGDWDDAPALDSDGLPPVRFLSIEEPTERMFFVAAPPRWFQDMEVMLRLSEEIEGEPQDESPASIESGMSWQKAAERMERLRQQGELFTSQGIRMLVRNYQ